MDSSNKLGSNSPRVGTRRTFAPPGVVLNSTATRESFGGASPLLLLLLHHHHVLPPAHRSMSIVLIGLPRNLIVLLDDVLRTRNNSCASLSLTMSTDTLRTGIPVMPMSTLTSHPRDPIQSSSTPIQSSTAPQKSSTNNVQSQYQHQSQYQYQFQSQQAHLSSQQIQSPSHAPGVPGHDMDPLSSASASTSISPNTTSPNTTTTNATTTTTITTPPPPPPVPSSTSSSLSSLSTHRHHPVGQGPPISFKQFLFHPLDEKETAGGEKSLPPASAKTEKETKKRAKLILMLLPRAVMLLKSKNQFLKEIQFELMNKNKELLDLHWDGAPKHIIMGSSGSPGSSGISGGHPGVSTTLEVKKGDLETLQQQNLLILRINRRWNKPLSMSSVLPARLGRKRSHREVEDDYYEFKRSSEESERRSLDSQASQTSQTSQASQTSPITRSRRLVSSDLDASSITLA